jgi:hypothetical protein
MWAAMWGGLFLTQAGVRLALGLRPHVSVYPSKRVPPKLTHSHCLVVGPHS